MAGTAFGEVEGRVMPVVPRIVNVYHVSRGFMMRVIFRGRYSTW